MLRSPLLLAARSSPPQRTLGHALLAATLNLRLHLRRVSQQHAALEARPLVRPGVAGPSWAAPAPRASTVAGPAAPATRPDPRCARILAAVAAASRVLSLRRV